MKFSWTFEWPNICKTVSKLKFRAQFSARVEMRKIRWKKTTIAMNLQRGDYESAEKVRYIVTLKVRWWTKVIHGKQGEIENKQKKPNPDDNREAEGRQNGSYLCVAGGRKNATGECACASPPNVLLKWLWSSLKKSNVQLRDGHSHRKHHHPRQDVCFYGANGRCVFLSSAIVNIRLVRLRWRLGSWRRFKVSIVS